MCLGKISHLCKTETLNAEGRVFVVVVIYLLNGNIFSCENSGFIMNTEILLV